MAQADPNPNTPAGGVVAGLFVPGLNSAVPSDALLLFLKRRRDRIAAEIEATPWESYLRIQQLVELQDEIAVQMSELPIRTMEGAYAKLEVAADYYGQDLGSGCGAKLFGQALAWLEAARPKAA